MGLPELSLGVLPGFGGTQRLPRLVGLQQAVQMMLTSKPIKEKAALRAGLLDGVVPADQLLAAARKLALEIAAGLKPRNLSLFRWVSWTFTQLQVSAIRLTVPFSASEHLLCMPGRF